MNYILPKDFAEQIYVVAHMGEQYIINGIRNLGLNVDQATLIKFVGANPGSRQKEICTALNRQAATVSNMIKRLEEKNLIIRRTDPNNSREKQVFLLPEGTAMINDILQVAQDLEVLVTPCRIGDSGVDIRQFYEILLPYVSGKGEK